MGRSMKKSIKCGTSSLKRVSSSLRPFDKTSSLTCPPQINVPLEFFRNRWRWAGWPKVERKGSHVGSYGYVLILVDFCNYFLEIYRFGLGSYLLEPEPDLLNLNLRSGSGFSSFPEPNLGFRSRFSKILQEPDRPGPRHNYIYTQKLQVNPRIFLKFFLKFLKNQKLQQ